MKIVGTTELIHSVTGIKLVYCLFDFWKAYQLQILDISVVVLDLLVI